MNVANGWWLMADDGRTLQHTHVNTPYTTGEHQEMATRQIFTLATYVAAEAFRTRFFAVIVILLMTGLGLTSFIGQVAIAETLANQSSWLAAFLRLSAMYVISLFVITSIAREFHDHSIYLWLSFPMQRSTYFFGKFGGFALVACLTAVLYGVALSWYVPGWQVGLWTLSLFCELLIIISLSLLCVFTFPQMVQAFSITLGFYILARSVSVMQLMTQGPLLKDTHTWTSYLIDGLVEMLAMLLPHLDRFTQTEWLVYHTGSLDSLIFIFIQTVIYVVLLATMSLFDLYRKNL